MALTLSCMASAESPAFLGRAGDSYHLADVLLQFVLLPGQDVGLSVRLALSAIEGSKAALMNFSDAHQGTGVLSPYCCAALSNLPRS
jgi:hypothetical protein